MKTITELEKEIEDLLNFIRKCKDCDFSGGDYCREHLFMLDRDRTTLKQTKAIAEMIEEKCNELKYPRGNAESFVVLDEILSKLK